jgi:hypothetical protein
MDIGLINSCVVGTPTHAVFMLAGTSTYEERGRGMGSFPGGFAVSVL